MGVNCILIGSAMQSYNNSSKDRNFAKKIISDFLGFLKYKVDNDKLSLSEMQDAIRVIDKIDLHGTANDFAEYYGQSPVNVRSQISRKMLEKPIRAVLYSFRSFSKIVPDKWKHPCCTHSADI